MAQLLVFPTDRIHRAPPVKQTRHPFVIIDTGPPGIDREIARYRAKLEGRWVRCRLTGYEGAARGFCIRDGSVYANVFRDGECEHVDTALLDVCPAGGNAA